MPTLLIAGELDGMSPPDLNRAWADFAPRVAYQMIAGAAQISNVNNADDFMRALLQFLVIAHAGTTM